VDGGGKHTLALVGRMPHMLLEGSQPAEQEHPLIVPCSQLSLCCLVVSAGNILPPQPDSIAQLQKLCMRIRHLLLQDRHMPTPCT
jgi:hypothetical protein